MSKVLVTGGSGFIGCHCILMGWQPRSNGEAIVATGESLVKLGLLRVPRRR
ncbi:MAG TPA: hypothetical protein VGL87_00325 [Steroidobacteraceae bacterium]